jgi:hypothetical protein
MEMERKMARNQDGKLVKAAPFGFYSLMYLRRAVMKRQRERLPLHNTGYGMLKVRKDGKTKEKPLPFH